LKTPLRRDGALWLVKRRAGEIQIAGQPDRELCRACRRRRAGLALRGCPIQRRAKLLDGLRRFDGFSRKWKKLIADFNDGRRLLWNTSWSAAAAVEMPEERPHKYGFVSRMKCSRWSAEEARAILRS